MIEIKMTPFQRSNLLQFMNRIETKGVDEARALLEVYYLIQNSTDNIPPIVDQNKENSDQQEQSV